MLNRILVGDVVSFASCRVFLSSASFCISAEILIRTTQPFTMNEWRWMSPACLFILYFNFGARMKRLGNGKKAFSATIFHWRCLLRLWHIVEGMAQLIQDVSPKFIYVHFLLLSLFCFLFHLSTFSRAFLLEFVSISFSPVSFAFCFCCSRLNVNILRKLCTARNLCCMNGNERRKNPTETTAMVPEEEKRA